MRRFPAVFLTLLLCCAGAGGPADLGELLRPIRSQQNVPALAAGAWHDGAIVGLGAVGLRRMDKDASASIDDRWHIGSCSKAMTATLAAVLVHDGVIRWDSTVAEILSKDSAEGWDQVTLEELLRHCGGAPADLPEMVFALRGQQVDRSRRLVVQRLLRDPPRDVGTFRYSNAGYVIAGRMLERAGGDTWERLLFRRVFEPLGIRSAGFGAPGLPGSIDQPRGHRANGFPLEPSPFADNPLAIGPAGTVHLSLTDWLKFVGAHLDAAPEHPLGFTAETLQKLHFGEPFDEPGRGYAMGWGVEQAADSGRTVLFHDGSNTLWYASVWASPSDHLAIVAVANQGGDAGQTACHEAIEAVRRSLAPAAPRLSRD